MKTLQQVFLSDKINELESISKEIMNLSVHSFLLKDDDGKNFEMPKSVNDLLNKQNVDVSKLNTRALHVIEDLRVLKEYLTTKN